MSVIPRLASASITRGSLPQHLVALGELVDGHVRLAVGDVVPRRDAVAVEVDARLVDGAVVAVPADHLGLARDRVAGPVVARRRLRRLAQLDRGEAPAVGDLALAAEDRRGRADLVGRERVERMRGHGAMLRDRGLRLNRAMSKPAPLIPDSAPAPTGRSRTPPSSRTRRCRRRRRRTRGRASSSAERGADAAISSVPPPSGTTCEPPSSGTQPQRGQRRGVAQRRVGGHQRPVGQRGDRGLEVQHAAQRDGDDPAAAGGGVAAQLADALAVGAPAAADVERAVDLQHVAAVERARRLDPRRPRARARRAPPRCPATSASRSGAPGRASTARSPQTTTVSSTKAESGSSSAGSTSRTAQPAPASAAT